MVEGFYQSGYKILFSVCLLNIELKNCEGVGNIGIKSH